MKTMELQVHSFLKVLVRARHELFGKFDGHEQHNFAQKAGWGVLQPLLSRLGSATASTGDEIGKSVGIAAPFWNQSNALRGTKEPVLTNFDNFTQQSAGMTGPRGKNQRS